MEEFVEFEIDLGGIKFGDNYYSLIGETLGFFKGFGANWHGVNDCLASYRHPTDGIVENPIRPDQRIRLKIKGLSSLGKRFPNSTYSIILLIERANTFHSKEYGSPLIDLLLE